MTSSVEIAERAAELFEANGYVYQGLTIPKAWVIHVLRCEDDSPEFTARFALLRNHLLTRHEVILVAHIGGWRVDVVPLGIA